MVGATRRGGKRGCLWQVNHLQYSLAAFLAISWNWALVEKRDVRLRATTNLSGHSISSHWRADRWVAGMLGCQHDLLHERVRQVEGQCSAGPSKEV